MTNRFKEEEPQYANDIKLPVLVATNDTAELLAYALQGIGRIFREGYRYKKSGVLLTNLVPAHQIQTNLFDTKDRERSQRLMAVVDHLNTQLGAGTIQYAVAGLTPGWITRSARRSPRYTTRWEELVVVQAI
jgi:DNA polymerase V